MYKELYVNWLNSKHPKLCTNITNNSLVLCTYYIIMVTSNDITLCVCMYGANGVIGIMWSRTS